MGVSLGILAGMGPRSTAPFIDMLVTDCQVVCGAKYDMDFPEMHIISCQPLSGLVRKLIAAK